MKKLFSFFIIFLFVHLHAQSTQKSPSYFIKLGAYKYYKNAESNQKNVNLDTFIIGDEDFYRLYGGCFKSKTQARKKLKQVQIYFKDAYITTISSKKRIPKIPKIVKKRKKKKEKRDYLLIGKTYFQTGEYESALAAFDHLLIEEPNNQLARLEYARTLYMLGFYKPAKKEFMIVLNSNPPEIVKRNIKAYIKKIDSFSRKHIFYGLVGIGITYDDNLGFNTEKKTTHYGGLELQNDTNMTKGFYTGLKFGLNHLYVSDNFSWSNSLYSYNEFQNEDIDNLNFLNFMTSISKKYHNFKISLPTSLSYMWLDGRSYSFTSALIPTFNYQPNDLTNYKISLKYQKSNIFDDHNRNYIAIRVFFF